MKENLFARMFGRGGQPPMCPHIYTRPCVDEATGLPSCFPKVEKDLSKTPTVEEWRALEYETRWNIHQYVNQNATCPAMKKNGFQWASRYLGEWVELNPRPTLTRNGLISSLEARVSSLEAALAEKGGEK